MGLMTSNQNENDFDDNRDIDMNELNELLGNWITNFLINTTGHNILLIWNEIYIYRINFEYINIIIFFII